MAEESNLERYFRKMIRRDLGGSCHKLVPHEAGIPDRLVLLPGLPIELVEMKAAGETLRPDQRVWHNKAARLGHRPTVLAGRAEVDAWLAERRAWLDLLS